MDFDQFAFSADILAGIKGMGYTKPTPIQTQAIPPILKGQDVLGLAQTGTGKTAAFVLPILQRLTKKKGRGVRALIVTPTRELAEQICEMCGDLAKATKIRSMSIYGGVSKVPQLKALREGAEIVAACPGRLLDHMNGRAIDLSKIEVLVLDEADRMCDMGFLPDIRRIIKRLPKERQTLFFCATMPNDIRKISDRILRNPAIVQIGTIAPAKTVSHAIYPVSQHLKTKLLYEILKRTATGRVLIFTRTKHRADKLARNMKKRKFNVSSLQGNMTQNKRQAAIDGFKNGKYDILVATDIAARGIDVVEISHVINFDMPATVDDYTHRIGRTGRADQVGDAYTLMVRKDETLVRNIEKALNDQIERRKVPDFDYDGPAPQRNSPRPYRKRPKQSESRSTKTGREGFSLKKRAQQRKASRRSRKRTKAKARARS